MGKLIMGDIMKRRKKNKLKKIINNKYLYLGVFLFLIVISYLTITDNINIEKYFRDVLFYPAKYISSVSFVDDVNGELEKENADLRRMLDVKESLSSYDIIYSVVIERNNSYWNNSVTINKGSLDGIEKGMAVVDYKGLVGTVEKVNSNNSLIKLITSSDKYNNVSVKILGNKEINKLLKISNNKFIIEGINKNIELKVGDKVVTNGLSNKFPSGITVGEISSIDSDFYNVSNIATVSISADIDNMRFVAVLKRKI